MSVPLEQYFRDDPAAAPRRAAALVALFLAALVVSLAALARVIPDVSDPGRMVILRNKLSHLETRAGDYDVLLLGNSRVHRHFDARLMEDVLARKGIDVSIANLGVPGMSSLELRDVVDVLERKRPERLRLVVLDPGVRTLQIRQWTSDREMRSHSWENTQFAVSFCLAADAPAAERLGAAWRHLGVFRRRAANLGRAARVAFPSTDGVLPPRPYVTSFERGGFVPLDDEDPETTAERRERFAASSKKWQRRLADPERARGDVPELSEFHRRHLVSLRDRVSALGARLVFVVGPDIEWGGLGALVDADVADVPTFVYLNGVPGPDVWDIDLWYDHKHLNRRGAAIVSERLARDIAPLLRDEQGE